MNFTDTENLEDGWYSVRQHKISIGKKRHFLLCVDDGPKYVRITDPMRIERNEQAIKDGKGTAL